MCVDADVGLTKCASLGLTNREKRRLAPLKTLALERLVRLSPAKPAQDGQAFIGCNTIGYKRPSEAEIINIYQLYRHMEFPNQTGLHEIPDE